MSGLKHSIIAVATGFLAAARSSVAGAQADATHDAQVQLDSLYASIERGDTAALRSRLSTELRWVVGSGAVADRAQLLAFAALPTPARFTIDSLHAQLFADALIADYIRRDRWPLGDSSFTTAWRAVAIFTRTPHAWQLVRHSLAWLAQPVREFPIDSSALQSFVGQYRIAPNYVDNVHWESGHLVATSSGQSSGARLVPVSSTAFSPDGIGSVLVFERDPRGRVIGYVQAYPGGRIIRASRLP